MNITDRDLSDFIDYMIEEDAPIYKDLQDVIPYSKLVEMAKDEWKNMDDSFREDYLILADPDEDHEDGYIEYYISGYDDDAYPASELGKTKEEQIKTLKKLMQSRSYGFLDQVIYDWIKEKRDKWAGPMIRLAKQWRPLVSRKQIRHPKTNQKRTLSSYRRANRGERKQLDEIFRNFAKKSEGWKGGARRSSRRRSSRRSRRRSSRRLSRRSRNRSSRRSRRRLSRHRSPRRSRRRLSRRRS